MGETLFLFNPMSLKEAGKQLLQLNFGKSISELVTPSSYRGGSGSSVAVVPPSRSVPMDIMSFGGNGVGAYFSWGGVSSALQAYEKCPPLQAVCNRRALAFTNGEITIINSANKPSTSSQSKKVLKLLQNPNPLQTRAAFLAQIHIYIDLVGYAIVVPIRPVGFEMYESDTMWVIPPTLCNIQNTGNLLNFQNGGIDAVQIGSVWVKPEDVMIITDINPSINNMVIPGEKIKSLELPINNIIGAYESESTLIYHRGPSGIISSQMSTVLGAPIPIGDTEKEAIHAGFHNAYGFAKGQTHYVLTNAAIEYTKTGFNFEELGLHKTIENGTKAICDTIGFPTELMGIVNPTYANKESSDKEVYTKYIIPNSINIAQQLSSYLLSVDDQIEFSYSHVPELQQDKGKEAIARKTLIESLKIEFDLDLITQNQMLIVMGLEPLGPEGDLRKSQIPPGNVPLAVTLGVGGVQALTAVLSEQELSEEARQATLEIVFGLKPEDARRMSSINRTEQSQQITPAA